jgi:hypothetical protein
MRLSRRWVRDLSRNGPRWTGEYGYRLRRNAAWRAAKRWRREHR